jgi:hypothetical protein
MRKKRKGFVIATIVLAMAMVITGIVGAALTFPSEANMKPAQPLVQAKTVKGKTYDSVKIESGVVDLQVGVGDVTEAQIRLNGEVFRKIKKSDDFIQTKVRNGVLRISFARNITMNQTVIFGLGGDDAASLKAEVVLPNQLYRSIDVRSLSGDVQLTGLEGRFVDVDTETGNITYNTAQTLEQLRIRAESDHGSVMIFGETIGYNRETDERDFDLDEDWDNDNDEDRYDYDFDDLWDDQRKDGYSAVVGTGPNWVELESEHGKINVKQD